jgi:nitroreductase
MSVLRQAPVAHPILELIAGRWSPRAFSGRPVDREILARLFEAARWAPSCFNEQPWAYVIASQDDPDAFTRLGSCLTEGNAWAKRAWMLALSVARLTFDRNGKPNLFAWHDVGAASENLFLQAAHLGICVHEMAGFDRALAREVAGLDANHEPVAMIAIGYPGDPAELTEVQRVKETALRERRPMEQFVFGGVWGEPATF